jgi:NADH-quinone oxidoreductase subunit L
LSLPPWVLLAILFSPLAAFVLQALVGTRLFAAPSARDGVPRANRARGALVSVLGVLVPLGLVAVYVVPHLFIRTAPYSLSVEWLDFGFGLRLHIGLLLDNTSKVLVFMVTLVCAMIHVFSVEYMKLRDGDPEPRYPLFFAYLSLFTFAMLLLTLSDNLLTLFIGWELMGLCSYLLIGFYYEKKTASDAAVKAFMTTRVGDVLLLLGIVIMWTACGSLGFADIEAGVRDGRLGGALLTAAGLLALGGAIGKSAQFPLHTWLPDAMEGPTPVSALIHAATMVAAGVYLAARMLAVGVLDASALLFIAYVGGLSAVFAASIAFVQTDIKRVLAYSTISQLGYMMLAVGVQNYAAALFHLVTHAFFKACLFLGSGSVIHAMHQGLHHVHSHADAQDMRNMGGLRRRMPWTFWTFLVATLALSGVPLTSGFLSKDAVLAGSLAYGLMHPQHLLLPVMGFSAALMTAFYMFRLVFLSFFGEPGARAADVHRDDVLAAHRHVHESPVLITGPLAVLAAFSLFLFWALPQGGWVEDVLRPGGDVTASGAGRHVAGVEGRAHEPISSAALTSAGQEAAAGHDAPGAHGAHTATVVLSLVVAGAGILLAALFYPLGVLSSAKFARSLVARVLERKYGVDELYDALFVRFLHRLHRASATVDDRIVDGAVNGAGRAVAGRRSATWLSGAIDRYVVDGAVDGTGWVLRGIGSAFRRAQTGMVQNYLLVVFTGLVVIVFVVTAALR